MSLSFGKDLGIQQIDPKKIKLADDKITSAKPFRNPRSNLNPKEMAEKRESIRKIGLLKYPTVRPLINDPDGFEFQMVAGSLRLRSILFLIEEDAICYNAKTGAWESAKIVYTTIPCSVRECDEDTAIRISIAENLEHSQVPELDMMEYCDELEQLTDDLGQPKYTRTQIAEICNRSESWISLTLRLNELQPAYKKLMRDGKLSRTTAIQMVLGTDKENFDKVIQKCTEDFDREVIDAKVEEKRASEAVEDAEIDLGTAEIQKDQEAASRAKKNLGTARKRVSMASEKRITAVKKKEEGIITAEAVNSAIISIPGIKKNRPKPIATKTVRDLYDQFTQEKEEIDPLIANVALGILDLILGKRPSEPLKQLIANEKVKLENPPTIEITSEEQIAVI